MLKIKKTLTELDGTVVPVDAVVLFDTILPHNSKKIVNHLLVFRSENSALNNGTIIRTMEIPTSKTDNVSTPLTDEEYSSLSVELMHNKVKAHLMTLKDTEGGSIFQDEDIEIVLP